ncbi:MAG: 4'-phosphopantetheinyl transferase superfamily protein [Pseudomonadota bacterium]
MRYAVPESDLQMWLLKRQDDTPDSNELLQHWLSELLGHASLIERTDAGKPFVANSGLQFNFSHSPHWFALSWRVGHEPVGVDIEDLGRRPSFAALAERYYHPAEKAKWLAAGASESSTVWLEIWTRKEAVLKAHGLGLRLQLNTLDTCHDAVQHQLIGCWQLHSFRLPDAVVSVSWPLASPTTAALRAIP